jgi:hypothetical protein
MSHGLYYVALRCEVALPSSLPGIPPPTLCSLNPPLSTLDIYLSITRPNRDGVTSGPSCCVASRPTCTCYHILTQLFSNHLPRVLSLH